MKKYLYVLCILLFIACKDEKPNPIFTSSETLYKIGDNPNWKLKDFDHSKWKSQWDIKWNTEVKKQVFFARKSISLNKNASYFTPFGIVYQTFGAYEVYWDGKLIGTNGKPGNEEENTKEGFVIRSFIIPHELATKGTHTLALRVSQFYENEHHRVTHIYIGEYDKLLREPLLKVLYIHILAGIFLIAAIYYFMLYINDRKKYTMLLFSFACFLFFFLIMMEYIKFYIPFHYSYFYTRLQIIGILTFLISFLIPFYFAVQFSLIKRKLFSVLYLFILLLIFIYYIGQYDLIAIRHGQAMWIASMLIISYSIYKKEKGSLIILIGLIFSFIVYKLSIYDISLFVSFTIILLCMFYILSIKLKEQRLAYENSLVQSTRLKLELLKKSIQPHFLMNTLTSLIDWIEEAPDKGVLFIEALAEEFDVLNQIENETLIPITQEIKLCKSHINIMKFRKEIDYVWEDDGITKNKEQLIPPAVILTLLENSITHCLPSDKNIMRFKLIFFTTDKTQEYTFLTFGKVRNQQKSTADGTGFKYIKARLTESYGDDWVFTSEAANEGWKNTITIRK